MNITEKSFYYFIEKCNLKIEKIKEENSPDFLVENIYAFEIKAFNKSGTEVIKNGMKSQSINTINVINKWLIDANKKINTYRKNHEIQYYYLVIYDNGRYYDSYEKIMLSITKSNLLKYQSINGLIYAHMVPMDSRINLKSLNGKNIKKGETIALHIKSNNQIKIFKDKYVNCKYY